MKKAIISAAILLVVTCVARPAQAASIPFINVGAFGIEICEQASPCGAAVFIGILQGRVGFNPFALGTFVVAINHQIPLPDSEGEQIFLTGGVFEFKFGLRRIQGVVLPGGILENNGDNTFDVGAVLLTTEGDLLNARVLLDHNVFPPIVRARVVSQPQ